MLIINPPPVDCLRLEIEVMDLISDAFDKTAGDQKQVTRLYFSQAVQ